MKKEYIIPRLREKETYAEDIATNPLISNMGETELLPEDSW